MRFVQASVMLLGGIGLVALIAWYYSISAWAVDGGYGLQGLLFPAGSEPDTDVWAPVLAVVVPAFIAWNAALLITTVLVLVDSVRKGREGQAAELTTGVFIVKLASIPFFVANFVPLALVAAVGAVLIGFGGVIELIGAAVAAILTYLTMLSTSIYGWASVKQLRREQAISGSVAAVLSFLLCLFVFDVLAGILLFTLMRRRDRANAVPILLHETSARVSATAD